MLTAHKKPCATCPWRRDATPGRFPAEAFRRLAPSAWDMNPMLFQCHDTGNDDPVVCAGFLERGAAHNLTIRLAYGRGEIEPRDRSGDEDLHQNYRAMAVANGVDPDDEALAPCRSNDQ